MPQLKERDPYAFPTQQLTVLGKIDTFSPVAHLYVYMLRAMRSFKEEYAFVILPSSPAS